MYSVEIGYIDDEEKGVSTALYEWYTAMDYVSFTRMKRGKDSSLADKEFIQILTGRFLSMNGYGNARNQGGSWQEAFGRLVADGLIEDFPSFETTSYKSESSIRIYGNLDKIEKVEADIVFSFRDADKNGEPVYKKGKVVFVGDPKDREYEHKLMELENRVENERNKLRKGLEE